VSPLVRSSLAVVSTVRNAALNYVSRAAGDPIAIISRSFAGRVSASDAKLPPGQYLTTDFPVVSAGPTPHISLDRCEFTIDNGSKVVKRWDWKSFRELPTKSITVDLHCVARNRKTARVYAEFFAMVNDVTRYGLSDCLP
jgi:DMSO/TMAO reductase YedYZ molybdopterin-dependent catalytic subunit